MTDTKALIAARLERILWERLRDEQNARYEAIKLLRDHGYTEQAEALARQS